MDSKSEFERHAHRESFPHYGAETKRSPEKARQSMWVCVKCGQRCERGAEQQQHRCVEDCIKYIVQYMTRTDNIQMDLPLEIQLLIARYGAKYYRMAGL